MKTLLCILPTLEKVDELTESLQDNVDIKIGNVLFVSDLENYERIGFIYHQESKFPFLLGNEMNNFSGYYFSDEWIEYLRNQEKIVDLLSCDYSRDINDLLKNKGIQSSIYYSTDTTGNTPIGDWILEKNVNGVDSEVSIKNIYFNDNIENWNVYLGVANHSLIVDTNGKVYGFGYNDYGQLGLGHSLYSVDEPTLINDISDINIIQVSVGSGHSLILDSSRNVYSFGNNVNGRTGLNSVDGSTIIPTKITTINNGTTNININNEKFIQVSAGFDYSLILDSSGNVYSFGNNVNGRTGLNSVDGSTIIPTKITKINNGTAQQSINNEKFIQVSAGYFHSLILDSSGNVYSFGNNADGRTGLNSVDGSTIIPTKITTINNGTAQQSINNEKFIQVSAGYFHSLILDSSGNVYSFGNNVNGRTGLNSVDGSNIVPTKITKITTINNGTAQQSINNEKFIQISAGFNHSLILDSNKNVYGFGKKQYYYNDNITGNILVPYKIDDVSLNKNQTVNASEDVSLNEKTTQIYAGESFSLFLNDDGNVYSIGGNWANQLGIGNDDQSIDFNSIKNNYDFTIRAFNDSFGSNIDIQESVAEQIAESIEESIEEVTSSSPVIPEYNLRYVRNQVGKSSSDRINRLKRGCCNKPSNSVKKVDKCCVTPTRILRRNAKKREDLVVKTYCD